MIKPIDGGLIYKETDLEAFIAEPFNALSSLTFLIPVVIFLLRLKGNYSQNKFLIFFCSPLLFIGGIGSTLFHGLRSSQWLLMMDWLPILILSLGISLYFWHKVLGKILNTALVIIGFVILQFISVKIADGQDSMNLTYFVRGNMIFLPMIIYAYRTKFLFSFNLFLSVLLFISALVFRYVDEKYETISIGTHFLWHISSAIGAYFLGNYIYKTQYIELNNDEVNRL
jgi:hemolysin III